MKVEATEVEGRKVYSVRAFNQGVAGYAAAIAYVLFIAILVLTVVQLLIGKRLVHYSS